MNAEILGSDELSGKENLWMSFIAMISELIEGCLFFQLPDRLSRKPE